MIVPIIRSIIFSGRVCSQYFDTENRGLDASFGFHFATFYAYSPVQCSRLTVRIFRAFPDTIACLFTQTSWVAAYLLSGIGDWQSRLLIICFVILNLLSKKSMTVIGG